MHISVIICTYNRAQNLPVCLGRLAGQQGVDGLEWEVLVVDNNSTDATREALAELARTLPIAIRYTFEPQQGLNYARNRGAQESLGRYFGYIDDDIQTSPQWLCALHNSFAEALCATGYNHNFVFQPALPLAGLCHQAAVILHLPVINKGYVAVTHEMWPAEVL